MLNKRRLAVLMAFLWMFAFAPFALASEYEAEVSEAITADAAQEDDEEVLVDPVDDAEAESVELDFEGGEIITSDEIITADESVTGDEGDAASAEVKAAAGDLEAIAEDSADARVPDEPLVVENADEVAVSDAQTPANEVIRTEPADQDAAISIEDATITYSESVPYTGDEVDIHLQMKMGDTVLTEGTDYTVEYSGRINATEESHVATIKGIGSYTGKVEKKFTITPIDLTDSRIALTGLAAEYTFTNATIEPKPTLKFNGSKTVTLEYNTDYTITYANNVNVGTATLKIVANKPHGQYKIQNYTGELSVTFKIVQKPISDADITVSGVEGKTYTGSAQEQSGLTLTLNGKALVKDTDYTVSYSDNINAGKATITITGKGNYSGSRQVTFAIGAASMDGHTVSVSPQSYTYNGGENKPSVTVSGLSATDFDVRYSDNVHAGTATVIVTGKENGNYTGTLSQTFTINRAEVSVSFNGTSADKVYDKTRNLKLSSKDFKVTGAVNGEKVSLVGISGSYGSADVGDYTIPLTFRIHRTDKEISNGKVAVNLDYDLANTTLSIPGNITPKVLTLRPGVAKSATDETLVPQTKIYGTADTSIKAKVSGIMSGDAPKDCIGGSLTRKEGEDVGKYPISIGSVKGKGNYAETVILESAYFQILPKSVSATDVGMVSIPNQNYTGSAIEPTITLKYTKKVGEKTETETLVKGKDFDVRYSNNVQPGVATATITGKGNYTGTRTASFLIIKVINNPTPQVTPEISVLGNVKTTILASPGTVYQLNLGGTTGKSFKSSKKNVATVNSAGQVTIKKAGKTKITFKVGKKKRTVVLTIKDPTIPTRVMLSAPTTAVKKGDVITLSAALPAGTNSAIKWKSSNKKVATVNNGVVTFKKKGKVTITATAVRGKKKAKITFKVGK